LVGTLNISCQREFYDDNISVKYGRFEWAEPTRKQLKIKHYLTLFMGKTVPEFNEEIVN